MPMEFFSKGKRNEFSEETDLIEFNRNLRKHNFNDVEGYRIKAFNRDINVDLKDQKIQIDGQEQNLDLKEKLSQVRWIIFKRHSISYRMAGKKASTTKIGVGFQGQDKRKNNIQRIILLNPEGYTLEKKK